MPPPNMTYTTFILGGERFHVDEVVSIKQGQPGKADFVGTITSITTDSHGEVQLGLRWFYRPEELPGGRKTWHGALELVDSDHTDVCHVGTVNSKCKVYTLQQFESLVPSGKPQFPEYFSRSLYLHKRKKLKKELPKYCFCKQPSNPDKLLLCCDGCSKWFHGACVRVTKAKAEEMDDWFCATCKPKHKKKRVKVS